MDTKIPQSLPLRGLGQGKLRSHGHSSARQPSEEALRQWERRMRRLARRRKRVEGAVRRSEERIDELWRKMTDDD